MHHGTLQTKLVERSRNRRNSSQ